MSSSAERLNGSLVRYWVEFRQLVKLAAPLLAAQLLVTGTSAVDTIMAGNYHANDLAGVAVGSSVWMPLYLFISGLLIATTSMVARFSGADDSTSIVNTVHQSIWLALSVSVVCMLVLFNADILLGWMSVEAEFAVITDGYLNALAYGVPGAVLFGCLRAFTEGMGRTKPFMISSALAFLLNIPLNYALIYGEWGLPELGGVGCGWATAFSMWFQVLVLGWFVSRPQSYDKVSLLRGWQWPNLAKIKPIADLGFPIALAVFAEVSIFSMVALLLAPLGAVTVAGHQIALSASHLIFIFPLSLSQAVTIRVGYYLGRQQQRRANFVARTGIGAAGVMALISLSLILTFREAVVGLYTQDAAVQAVALSLFLWMAIYQFPDHLQIAANASLRAYQDSRVPLMLILLCYWGVALPLGYVLAHTDWLMAPQGAQGFWMALVVGLTGTAILLGTRLVAVSRRVLPSV
ncbi:MAG: MATE family efflux transporter [Cellvibrionaceae bacterium]